MQFSKLLFNKYENFRFEKISSRRFKHTELMEHIHSLHSTLNGILFIEQVGSSAEGRSINLLTLGRGNTKILLWSQMHGDEPTATMALLDMLQYISSNSKTEEIQKILSNLTLLIIPMLNPDGAERFQRRTSLGIDMNRDAIRRQTPEAKILKSIRDKYNPEVGFNLHDQDPHYTVGISGEVSTIALLAPAFNQEKSDNDVRIQSKRIASQFAFILQQFIPSNISKYDDSFEPRAFGDSVQKWGTSTILVESGGWKGDLEKMFIRKLNCVGLLSVLYSISSHEYKEIETSNYDNIPMNGRFLYDIIIENVKIISNSSSQAFIVDIGINLEEIHESNGYVWKGRVIDIGDLSVIPSHERWNGNSKFINGINLELNEIVSLDYLRQLFPN